MREFLDGLDMPTLNENDMDDLEKPLDIQELETAITNMQTGKTPGPDGFTVEFYKKFSLQLTPLLRNMFNDSFERAGLPQSLTEALITVLLKPGKDAKECASYRPISLLNVDVKILSKVLAERINKIISDIISTDQTGFVRGRYSFVNIRKLLNVVHSPSPCDLPEVVVSLDAEKAFDRVEWEYLFSVLNRFGFGPKLISWIRLLYSTPKAAVVTNRLCSQYFPLARGTRQGCPLSPLLFILAIEPLAIKLRNEQGLHGINRMGIESKISLYADDLLIYVTDPMSCTPVILSILNNFSSFSGYKLNYSKSMCFPVNDKALLIQEADLPFCLSKSGFKYLGVNIAPSFSELFNANFTPILEKQKSDFQRWSTLYLSLAGRINCIKMNVLPKYLYLFQSLPVFLPKSFFTSLNRQISHFIWGGKTPRVRRSLLERPRKNGGLALPNYTNYYWAANLQKVAHWFQSPEAEWCRLEAGSCRQSSLAALITSKLPLSPAQFSSSPVVRATLRIWIQFRKESHLSDMSIYSPICNNTLFPAAKLDDTYKQWNQKNLTTCKDFFINNLFPDFANFASTFSIPNSSFYRYLQIRHFVQTHIPTFPHLPEKNILEDILVTPLAPRGQISIIYNQIVSSKKSSLDEIKNKWEDELGINISEEVWDRALSWVNDASSCARLNLIQFKTLHRLHYSKAKLAKIYSTINNTCDRCETAIGDLGHMFWACPKLREFWTSIFDILNQAFNLKLQDNPITAIFGTRVDLPGSKENVVAFATLIARRRILMEWKSEIPPKASMWLSDIIMFLKLEKIKYSVRGSAKKFNKIWDPLLTYFDRLTTLPQ